MRTSVSGTDFCGMALCSPPGRVWLRADYLMWWTSGTTLPPLVTTSPSTTPVSEAGVLPTAILYGDQTIINDVRSGFRTTIGMWLDSCHVWDLEFDYLNLGERANGYTATSTGDPILARPFFNVQTNQQASELVAYPGIVEGTVSVDAKDYFQSAGVLVSRNLCSGNCGCDPCDSCGDACGGSCGGSCGVPLLYCCRTDLLAGFRYYNLSDRLGVHEALRANHAGFHVRHPRQLQRPQRFLRGGARLADPDLSRPMVVGTSDQDRVGQQSRNRHHRRPDRHHRRQASRRRPTTPEFSPGPPIAAPINATSSR